MMKRNLSIAIVQFIKKRKLSFLFFLNTGEKFSLAHIGYSKVPLIGYFTPTLFRSQHQ